MSEATMNGATWKAYLRDIFEGFEAPENISLQDLIDRLRERNTDSINAIEENFTKLEREFVTEKVIRLLWDLAHLETKTPEEQRVLYAQLAQHYEKLFEWEEPTASGWIIIPGPFFP